MHDAPPSPARPGRARLMVVLVVVVIVAAVVATALGSSAGSNAQTASTTSSREISAFTGGGVAPPATPILPAAITTTSCGDAPSRLAGTRLSRIAAAAAATRLDWVDVSDLVPRDAPAPGWQDEYLGGSVDGITSLPAGTVSEDRTVLVPDGLEESFVRGFHSDAGRTRVFYAVYRFATITGATNVVDAVIRTSCQRRRDFLSTGDGIVGASDAGVDGGAIEMVLVRNRLIFDFYADGPVLPVDSTEQLALNFFEGAHNASPGPTDTTAVGLATASRACGRLFYLNSVPSVDAATHGELHAAAKDELSKISRRVGGPRRPSRRRHASQARRADLRTVASVQLFRRNRSRLRRRMPTAHR